jgi:hypothetical protein
MLDEQKELLAMLVEASRKVPRWQQQFRLTSFEAMGTGPQDYIEGAGLPERIRVLGNDVWYLDQQGFLDAQWNTDGSARFALNEGAFRYYEEFLAKRSEEPTAAIEEEVRRYLDRPVPRAVR